VPVITADDPVKLGEGSNEDRVALAPLVPGITADSLLELVKKYRTDRRESIALSLPGYRLFMRRRRRPNGWTFWVVVRDGQHTSHEDKALKRTDPRSLNSADEI